MGVRPGGVAPTTDDPVVRPAEHGPRPAPRPGEEEAFSTVFADGAESLRNFAAQLPPSPADPAPMPLPALAPALAPPALDPLAGWGVPGQPGIGPPGLVDPAMAQPAFAAPAMGQPAHVQLPPMRHAYDAAVREHQHTPYPRKRSMSTGTKLILALIPLSIGIVVIGLIWYINPFARRAPVRPGLDAIPSATQSAAPH
jgi:hypothetical protein